MFGLRFPDDEGTFETGMMIGTFSKVDLNKSKGNTFIGIGSGNEAICGETGMNGCVANTFIGTGAGNKTTSDQTKPIWYSCYNTFIGRSSGTSNISGYSNSFYGSYSGKNNTEGSQNTFVGADSGYYSNGNRNVFIGNSAGYNNKTGNENILIGHKCGSNSETNDQNILIGNSIETENSISNSMAFGHKLKLNQSNTIILGNNQIEKIVCNSQITTPLTESCEIYEEVSGLELINQLHPVSYMKGDKVEQGFDKQGLMRTIENFKTDCINESGVKLTSFIFNLIKSVQELSTEVNQLKSKIEELSVEESSVEEVINNIPTSKSISNDSDEFEKIVMNTKNKPKKKRR
jgi:hypothetical protein